MSQRRSASMLALTSGLLMGLPENHRALKFTSPMLENMSGKWGGSVAAKARGGISYLRALVVPTNPRTFLQSAARGAAISVSALWQNVLTDVQREAWWDAVLGSGTGKSFFTKVNQPRAYITNVPDRLTDQASADAPAPDIKLLPPTGTGGLDFTHPLPVIDDSANTMVIPAMVSGDGIFTGIDDDTDRCFLYIYATHQQRSSRFSRQHPYQLIRAISYDSVAHLGVAVTINLAELGLTTEAGEVMYVKTIAQGNDGRLSSKLEQRITIVA